MCPEIESARQRLQGILCELERCCADDETFSPQLVEEAHALVRLLRAEGYEMATRLESDKIVVDIEATEVQTVAARPQGRTTKYSFMRPSALS